MTRALSEDGSTCFVAQRVRGRAVGVGLVSLVLTVFTAGCSSPRGGWDLEVVQRGYPTLARLSGHRLGDMLPFASFEGDRVVLRACRFSSGRTIRVSGHGRGWPQAWARGAVSALDRGARGFALSLQDLAGNDPGSRVDSEIRILSLDATDEAAPIGLADTLSVCDISPAADGRTEVRGLLRGSVIRIKRARLDWRGNLVEVSGEEWVGALMHEIGHALGFAGHARTGDSILVRDQDRLRRAGRRALAGQPWRDETLEALYQLKPGQRLGTRRLSVEAISILHGIHQVVEGCLASSSRGVEIRSSVGDSQARVEWLLPDGRRLSVRMRHWRDELQAGGEITLRPDAATRLALQGVGSRLDEPRLLVD